MPQEYTSKIQYAASNTLALSGPQRHGRHEVALYVVKGQEEILSEIRWGEQLEHAASIGPGDFVYFTPFVPHEERNLSKNDTLEFVVVRSDEERISVKNINSM